MTEQAIRPYIRRTPMITVDGSTLGVDQDAIHLKLELFQYSGSFKTRGAFANLLLRRLPATGVVAASGGNHGAAVAFAANRLGTPATIFIPSITSPSKVNRIRKSGATLVIAGDQYSDALAASEIHAAKIGALAIHAFDQVETILGQGTIGLEIETDTADLDTLLVAVGGGGLIGGIASWYAGSLKIVAVESSHAPTLHSAFAANRPVDAPTGGIAADSLAPRRVGDLIYPICRAYVAPEVVLVTDEDIRDAQSVLWRSAGIVAEPGGAAAFAALLSRKYRPARTERVGVIVCGGNTTTAQFEQSIAFPADQSHRQRTRIVARAG